MESEKEEKMKCKNIKQFCHENYCEKYRLVEEKDLINKWYCEEHIKKEKD